MTDNSIYISIPVKFEIKTPPQGMTDYDPKALSPEQQTELNAHKLVVRKANLLYLKDHPEIKAIVSMIIRMTIVHKPLNIVEFIANLFNRPEAVIRKQVKEILKEAPIEYDKIPYADLPNWDY